MSTIPGIHRILLNAHWEEVIPLAVCMLFLMVLFWYLTVRICLDLTERGWRRKFSAERTRRETAEKANQAKTEFLASMGHEIRAPLNAIINFTELAPRIGLDAELEGHLATVRTSAQWLIHIANDVVEFSRCAAGKARLKNEPFSIRECVESALQMVRAQAEGRHLGIQLEIDSAVPIQVCGDFTRLLQVIFNLIDNAVRCTTDGGVRIKVETVSKEGREIVLGFFVEDTGVGIPRDQLDDFFKPLTQPKAADHANAEVRNFMLSAFGLPICEKNVSLMGGTLQVLSHLGAGTAIRFTAKFAATGEEISVRTAEREKTPAVCSAERPLSILLADQNAISRRLTKVILEAAGHCVYEAAEGPQVLRVFGAKAIDLVLLDLDIAPIDGQEVTQAIRVSEKPGLHTPIYALLNPAATLNRETCRAAGIHGFLSKPVETDAVLNIVAAIALSRPQRAATLEPAHIVSMSA